MGAAESKPEKEGTNNNQDRNDDREGGIGSNKNGSSSSEISTGTALAVGAAVGTALLGVAWGVSRYRSKESDERVGNHYRLEGINTKPVANYLNYNYSHSHEQKCTVKILSYNVWSREDYAIHERMKAIGGIVQLHSPHFICFQEITPAIYTIFQESSWWDDYYCSMSPEEASNKQYFCILLSKFPFVNPTITAPLGNGKELCMTTTKIGTNKSLVVATSHLKSRAHYDKFIKQRSDQARKAIALLGNYPNVIFGGDMNWDEKEDGEFPLLGGWVDAWTELRGEKVGNTFDTSSNEMLHDHWPVQMRFDRILCKLKGFKLDDIEIIGKEAIPDVFYQWNDKELPVLPSDHYGLLLTMCT